MKDEPAFAHVLYHDDLTKREVGLQKDGYSVIARGLGKYLECACDAGSEPRLYVFGERHWSDYRLRAVVTPVSFEISNPTGVFCGIVARYKDKDDFIALVLDRDDRLKLLRRTYSGFELLASAPLEFCMGQSLTLTLTVRGNDVCGTAGPYTGATTIRAALEGSSGGRAGFISTAFSRFGPHTVECEPDEALRITTTISNDQAALQAKGAVFPQMKLERTVPLHGLVTGENLEIADVNGDGKLEILAAQSSDTVAKKISLTELTCLTALNFEGRILWQAGMPDVGGSDGVRPGILPFRFHDLFGDGHPVVVCVFGYDIQVRDAKTGKVLMSAQTPSTLPVSAEFKAVVGGNRSGYGDETLNMNVRRMAFCDTQGTGSKKEIVVADDFNLAVLDPLEEPALHPIFRHRGDLRGGMWIGDIDGDGKDEILAGSSVIDHDGSLIQTLRWLAQSASTKIFETALGGVGKRTCVSAGAEGIRLFQWSGAGTFFDSGNDAQEIRGDFFALFAGKFRADSPGIQYATTGRSGVTFFDANFHKIGMRHCDAMSGALGDCVVNWTGKTERLLLVGLGDNEGLIDGFGDLVVPVPNGTFHRFAKVLPAYCPDGRDAIAAWNRDELAIYVPAE